MEERVQKFWLIPIILIVLFLISICDLEYGFYTFLRICVFVMSLLLAFCIYMFDGSTMMIAINVIIAILWNPILPIYLDKDTWVALDIIASILECVIGFYSYKLWKDN